MSERFAYILLSNEKWWNRICGQKSVGKTSHAFVRRGIVGPQRTELILFYVTYPSKEIRGFGEFVERATGNARALWKNYGQETCLNSFEEYLAFLEGRTRVTFIRFRGLHLLDTPISANTISQITGINRMPRSGRYINKETAHRLI